MATIDDWNTVADVMSGKYVADQPLSVTAYTNAWGNPTYGVVFQGERPDRYRESHFVRSPVVIWRYAEDGWLSDPIAAERMRDARLQLARANLWPTPDCLKENRP